MRELNTFKKISIQDYDRINSLPPVEAKKERDKILEGNIPNEYIYGYGYYGSYLYKDKTNETYIGIRIGETCD